MVPAKLVRTLIKDPYCKMLLISVKPIIRPVLTAALRLVQKHSVAVEWKKPEWLVI